MSAIAPGDLVRLEKREDPFWDDTRWWWRVTDVNDAGGLDVIRVAGNHERRQGVPPSRVLDVKKSEDW